MKSKKVKVKKEVKKSLKEAMKEVEEVRLNRYTERHTAISSATIIKFNKDHMGGVQELLIKHDGESRFIEITRIFFDYNTIFMKCMGTNFYPGTVEVVYYGQHGPRLKLLFGVELDTYEHALMADDFIVEEFIRFKVVSFTEVYFTHDGKEKIESHDELREVFNATCKIVEGIREPKNKTSRTMKSRKERKKKSADKHK